MIVWGSARRRYPLPRDVLVCTPFLFLTAVTFPDAFYLVVD